MRYALGVAAALVVAGLLLIVLHMPSAEGMYGDTEVTPQLSVIKHGGRVYRVAWGPETRYAGYARYFARSFDDDIPFLTHEAVLTTGDFADPAKVRLGAVANHQTTWRAREKPKGNLWMVHCIPARRAVIAQLEALEDGQWLELVGHEAVHRRINREDGSRFLEIQADDHPIFLVTAARTIASR